MNNQNEQQTEGTEIENSNTELKNNIPPINWDVFITESKSNKSHIRWDMIMTIIGLIMMIYAAVALPGAGRIIDNEFVPSKLMSPLIGMAFFGLILFIIGILLWLFSFWSKK